MSVGVPQATHARRAGLLLLTCALGLALGLALGAAPAAAQSEPVAPRLDAFVGGHYALGLGHLCQRDVDVDECTTGESFVGAHALVLLRPFEHWSFGPSVAYAVTPSTASTSAGSFDSALSLLRVSAEARYWLSTRRRSGLYLAAEAGLASMSETLSLSERRHGAVLPPKSSISQAAPLLGAGLGLSLALPFGLGIAPSLRGFATFFGDDPDSFTTDLGAHRLGTLYWIALCLDASFGFGL